MLSSTATAPSAPLQQSRQLDSWTLQSRQLDPAESAAGPAGPSMQAETLKPQATQEKNSSLWIGASAAERAILKEQGVFRDVEEEEEQESLFKS